MNMHDDARQGNVRVKEMEGVVDSHFHVQELNAMVKTWIRAKMQNESVWGDITRYVHLMLGGGSPHIHRIAAYTELVILALDIIDDLSDQDHHAMPWMQQPQPITLNAAIALLVAVIGEIGKLKEQNGVEKLPLVSDVNQLLSLAANGQHQDIGVAPIESEEDYIALIHAKSVPLKMFACYMGYSCVESCEPSTIEQIQELARNLAVVAQIQNDLRDLLGFDIKNDLIHRKRTLPILYLLSECSQRFPIFKDYYEGKIAWGQLLAMKEECMLSIWQSGCVEYSIVIQGLYLNKIEKLFQAIPGDDVWKKSFGDMVIARYRTLLA